MNEYYWILFFASSLQHSVIKIDYQKENQRTNKRKKISMKKMMMANEIKLNLRQRFIYVIMIFAISWYNNVKERERERVNYCYYFNKQFLVNTFQME